MNRLDSQPDASQPDSLRAQRQPGTDIDNGADAVAESLAKEWLDEEFEKMAVGRAALQDESRPDQINPTASASDRQSDSGFGDGRTLSELAKDRAAQGEMIASRRKLWNEHADNDRGYENTARHALTAQVLSEMKGKEVTENEVVEYAASADLCATENRGDSGPAGTPHLGASTRDEMCLIIEEMGEDIDAAAMPMRGQSIDELADCVESGEIVIADVWELPYRNPTSFKEANEIFETVHGEAAVNTPETDHTVWVTGVHRDPHSLAPTEFYVNDTARAYGGGLRVSASEMREAWEERGGTFVLVTKGSRGG